MLAVHNPLGARPSSQERASRCVRVDGSTVARTARVRRRVARARNFCEMTIEMTVAMMLWMMVVLHNVE